MLTVAATQVKHYLGRFFEAAQTEPVLVERSGRASVVMISFTEYLRLKAMEDKLWSDMANKAVEEGFLGEEDSQDWFSKMQGKLNVTA